MNKMKPQESGQAAKPTASKHRKVAKLRNQFALSLGLFIAGGAVPVAGNPSPRSGDAPDRPVATRANPNPDQPANRFITIGGTPARGDDRDDDRPIRAEDVDWVEQERADGLSRELDQDLRKAAAEDVLYSGTDDMGQKRLRPDWLARQLERLDAALTEHNLLPELTATAQTGVYTGYLPGFRNSHFVLVNHGDNRWQIVFDEQSYWFESRAAEIVGENGESRFVTSGPFQVAQTVVDAMAVGGQGTAKEAAADAATVAPDPEQAKLEAVKSAVPGDFDGDGEVTYADLDLAKAILAENRTLDGIPQAVWDVNGDGKLSILTVMKLMEMLKPKVTVDPPDGSVFSSSSIVYITISANPSNGASISKIEWYLKDPSTGNWLLRKTVDNANSLVYGWGSGGIGTFYYQARTTDNKGNTTITEASFTRQ